MRFPSKKTSFDNSNTSYASKKDPKQIFNPFKVFSSSLIQFRLLLSHHIDSGCTYSPQKLESSRLNAEVVFHYLYLLIQNDTCLYQQHMYASDKLSHPDMAKYLDNIRYPHHCFFSANRVLPVMRLEEMNLSPPL